MKGGFCNETRERKLGWKKARTAATCLKVGMKLVWCVVEVEFKVKQQEKEQYAFESYISHILQYLIWVNTKYKFKTITKMYYIWSLNILCAIKLFILFNTHLLHSMSSGQATPNISMSLWHSSLARWHRDRHGMDTWPYTVHTGAYRAHRNILRSALHTRFTMGWKGCRRDQERKFKIIYKPESKKSKTLLKTLPHITIFNLLRMWDTQTLIKILTGLGKKWTAISGTNEKAHI